ncbi:kinase-like domain-containing protein [Rhizophagus irregularis DAOM 181602=DAOM 197198]|nr:kinase-like domain-containing protein [Rhizophagus irregularis DAOM 181602=DAOM 197198]
MISLLKAESKEELNQIFSDIEKSDGNDVKDWIDYYQITHILATMNSLASLMDVEIWNRYGNNINTAEAAHSLVNRTGKQLKLLSAILRGQKLDERHLKIIEIQDFSAVPYTKQDKSQVKRQLFAINRKEKRNQKNKEDNNSLKRKYGQSKIQPIDENNYEFKKTGKGGYSSVYSAIWKGGPLYYDYHSKNWIRKTDKKVVLKCLITSEFLNVVKAYLTDKDRIFLEVYGISQNPDTKEYVMVFHYNKMTEIYERYAKKSFTNWFYNLPTNDFIQQMQLKINYYYDIIFEWIPYDQLDDIEEIGKGGFATVYSAIWEDGPLYYDDDNKEWSREKNKKVALKCLNSSRNINERFLNEAKEYSIDNMGLCGEVDNIDEEKIYGVMPYVAPEVLRGNLYTQATDIYSFGMVMHFIATGRQPFADRAHDEFLALDICKEEVRPELNELEAPKTYIELMKRCWDSNPNNRPNAAEISDQIRFWKNVDFECIENYRKSNLSERKSLIIHPQAVYTSRILNLYTKNLSKNYISNHSDCAIVD